MTTAALTLTLAAAGLTGAAAYADSAPRAATAMFVMDTTYIVSARNGAPVRSGPGKNFPVIDFLPQGTQFGGTAQGNWVDMGNDRWVWMGKLDVM